MDLQKIKALIDLMAHSKLSELELEEGECRLRIVRADGPIVAGVVGSETRTVGDVGVAAVQPASSAPSQEVVPIAPAPVPEGFLMKAPMYGVFCLAPAPGEGPFVRVGDTVHKGQKLCMLEAMKLFHALEAERDGIVTEILADNGQEVDAGQPLFRIE
jgi:acetyl-CoA carboxylase biotin carboxyl carrier protein